MRDANRGKWKIERKNTAACQATGTVRRKGWCVYFLYLFGTDFVCVLIGFDWMVAAAIATAAVWRASQISASDSDSVVVIVIVIVAVIVIVVVYSKGN